MAEQPPTEDQGTGRDGMTGARLHAALIAATLWWGVVAAAPADFSGERHVYLVTPDGGQVAIGKLAVERREGGYRFVLDLDHEKLQERFLAMRPFRCLDGAVKSLCHFPYANAGRITAADLVDLEYQLMFIQKPRAGVHLDSRNGVYYELRWTDEGIDGVMRLVDMEPIIVPGVERVRPIARDQLEPVDVDAQWLPYLKIR